MGRPSDARERLIEATISVIFAQSYASVSVDALCATAGVAKSSFYHFFSSKQDLVLAAIESYWQRFEESVLAPTFKNELPPPERILCFFELVLERQLSQKALEGHMHGCPAGNLTLELSTLDELIRARMEQFFRDWIGYFEQTLHEAKEQGLVPATLDVALTAQALLAYYEGVILLAKGYNDPSLLHTMRFGALSLMQYQAKL